MSWLWMWAHPECRAWIRSFPCIQRLGAEPQRGHPKRESVYYLVLAVKWCVNVLPLPSSNWRCERPLLSGTSWDPTSRPECIWTALQNKDKWHLDPYHLWKLVSSFGLFVRERQQLLLLQLCLFLVLSIHGPDKLSLAEEDNGAIISAAVVWRPHQKSFCKWLQTTHWCEVTTLCKITKLFFLCWKSVLHTDVINYIPRLPEAFYTFDNRFIVQRFQQF